MRKLIFSLPVGVFLLFLAAAVPAETEPAPDLTAMSGEVMVYDIGFLFFDHMAEGQLIFAPGNLPGTYQAVLEARTQGVAASLTRNRQQLYVSHMELAPGGYLRSLMHESQTLKGSASDRKKRIKRYVFDYREGKVRYQRIKEDRITKDELLPLDRQNPPFDVLTAFYNFRAGAFGPLRPGARYVIPAFSHKGMSDIIVETVPEEERQDSSFFPSGGLLARVTLDPEIFDTGGGDVLVWFDTAGRPARGIVENIIGMGDVRGVMRSED